MKGGLSEPWVRVSVVIPTLNQERTLPYAFARLPPDLHEVIVVDGHSVDGTLSVARQLRPDVRIVVQTRRGIGNALACGLAAATGDIVVMVGLNGSADLGEIPRFVGALLGGADFATGSRFAEGGGNDNPSRLPALGSRALSVLVNLLYGTNYSDLCYGFNAIWRRHAPVLGLDATSPELPGGGIQWGDGPEAEALIHMRVALAGLVVAEVPSFEHLTTPDAPAPHVFRDSGRALRAILAEQRQARLARRHSERTPVVLSAVTDLNPPRQLPPLATRRATSVQEEADGSGTAATSVAARNASAYRSAVRSDPAGHAFISYVREDSRKVDELQQTLKAAGIPVWRDTSDLWPGEDWRERIRRAITDDALVFIACFSQASIAREKSYQNEELTLAIEQLRLRQPGNPWLIPARFDDCEIPAIAIGGGRALTSIQRADLFGDRFAEGAERLVTSVLRLIGQPLPPEDTADLTGAPQGRESRVLLSPEAVYDLQKVTQKARSKILLELNRIAQGNSVARQFGHRGAGASYLISRSGDYRVIYRYANPVSTGAYTTEPREILIARIIPRDAAGS